jgi:putative ABC transport system permease protein
MSVSIDIKYAVRLLLKKPAFTALTVLIVAVGLGLTLYTFSLLNNLVFKPLMLNGKSQIVAIEAQFDSNHLSRRTADVFHLQRAYKELDMLQSIGFYAEGTTLIGGANSGTNTSAKMYNTTYSSWNVFEFTGVQPILGRGFKPEDLHEGAEPVVVLSYKVWHDYFNGEESIVGTMAPLDAVPTRIIGIMPEDFAFPVIAEIWQPLQQAQVEPTEQTRRGGLFAFSLLKEGVTLTQLQQRLDILSDEIIPELPDNQKWRVGANGKYLNVLPFKKAAIVQYYTIFMAMFVVTMLILLLACINVSNLLLARVNERFKEIAIRVALGVPRKRLIFQMLLESIFICCVGGFLAVLLAMWGLEVSNTVFDQTYAIDNLKPFWWQVSLDSNGVIMLIGAVILMILITGFIPAWRALHGDFNAVLRDGTRGALSKKAASATQALVISEIFLSCVVLVMATILLSTSYAAGEADYGVETDNRITARLQLPPVNYEIRWDTEHEYADRLKRSDFYYKLKDELEQQPNVLAVSFMTQFPGTGEGTSPFEIEGRAAMAINEYPYSNNEGVSSDAWRAVGMKIVQGRDFDHRDIGDGVRSMIVNESIVKDFFPSGNAVGQRVRRAREGENDGEWTTIIGVVSDTFHGSAMSSSSATYNSYGLIDNRGPNRMNIAIHYLGQEGTIKQTLMKAVDTVDANVGVYHLQSYDSLIKQPMMLVTAVSKVFLLCGVIAVFLAASGIYAVASNSITQRTHEIGVRRALGSTDSKIMSLFMKQASKQLTYGLAIGVALSIWLVKYMAETMIINSGSYAFSLIAVPLLIIVIVIFATYVPTRKVVLMEPSDALHHD